MGRCQHPKVTLLTIVMFIHSSLATANSKNYYMIIKLKGNYIFRILTIFPYYFFPFTHESSWDSYLVLEVTYL